MKVERIHEEFGSHIEPPFDESWDDLTGLRWKAAVVEADAGVHAWVERAHVTRNGVLVDGQYSIVVGNSSISSFSFTDAWTFLTGVGVGACATGQR